MEPLLQLILLTFAMTDSETQLLPVMDVLQLVLTLTVKLVEKLTLALLAKMDSTPQQLVLPVQQRPPLALLPMFT